MSGLTFTEGTHPVTQKTILRFTLPAYVTWNDFEKYTKIFKTYLRDPRRKPFYVIFDCSMLYYVSPTIIWYQAQFMNNNENWVKRNILASAIVTDSYIVKGLINTLFAIKQPSRPNLICESEGVALFFFLKYPIMGKL